MKDANNLNCILGEVVENDIRLDWETAHSTQKLISLLPHQWEICDHGKLIKNLGNHQVGSNLLILGNVEPNIFKVLLSLLSKAITVYSGGF
ncbi:MAG: hypothetical protein WBG32_03345 [Nodosilinea sp.]